MRIIVVTFFISFGPAILQAVEPQVLIRDYELELVAQQPDIVTPVSIALDGQQRLLVVENHTHQRPEDYQGPTRDRIRLIDIAKNKRISNFYQGESDTMSIRVSREGAVYVATRREIFRLVDADENGQSEQKQSLVNLQTTGDYPHNGLAGLAFDYRDPQHPWLYFGLGENLGHPYSVVGSDQTKVSGEGEGGSIYRCNLHGGEVTRIATGFWNPFGNCFDDKGRLFSVDNDPDASPPCRLLHIVPSGDYGYQFRYGRSGRHPLQAWDGQFPGTLGMAAGTGEAPCEMVAHNGRLWVTSWGDHRIERYRIQSAGARCVASREIVVQGDKNFRPVGLAVSTDGTIFFSDWVDRSYPVHGKGKIWRLRPTSHIRTYTFPDLSEQESQALAKRTNAKLADLDLEDSFLRQAAVYGLSQSRDLEATNWENLQTAQQKIGVLQALRWRAAKKLDPYLTKALADHQPEVRLLALRMIADERKTEFRDQVMHLLQKPPTDHRTLQVLAAVVLWLDQGEKSKNREALDQFLVQMIQDPSRPVASRIASLKLLPIAHEFLKTADFYELMETPSISTEVVRLLVIRGAAEDQARLRSVITNDGLSMEHRLDAISGLQTNPENKSFVKRLTTDSNPQIQYEAARVQRHIHQTQVDESRPDPNEIDRWMRVLPDGDVARGRRVFFGAVGSQCSRCHQYQGQGSEIGPDLSQTHRRATKRWLLESILLPSQEVSPRYLPVAMVTVGGQTYSGLAIEGPGEKGVETIQTSDGASLKIESDAIESRQVLSTSIMPSGFERQLSLQEISDLIAFLMNSDYGS